jgi:hypothetical protein
VVDLRHDKFDKRCRSGSHAVVLQGQGYAHGQYSHTQHADLSASLCEQVSELPSRELVPGDVVELHVGDRVPADIRVIALKTATLRAEQASLTGESVAVLKSLGAVSEEACELQAKVRPLHMLCFAPAAGPGLISQGEAVLSEA